MAKLKVTLQEAGALRRFRNSADGRHIKNVLDRVLGYVRDNYEDNPATEEARADVIDTKLVLRVLFDDELERDNAIG